MTLGHTPLGRRAFFEATQLHESRDGTFPPLLRFKPTDPDHIGWTRRDKDARAAAYLSQQIARPATPTASTFGVPFLFLLSPPHSYSPLRLVRV